MNGLPAETLSLAARGDMQALQEISRTYGPQVYGFLQTVEGGHAADARKKIADAFASALRQYRNEKSRFGFRAEVARFLMMEVGMHPEQAGTEISEAGDPRSGIVFQALKKMPGRSRAVLLLRYKLDFLHDEIAWILRESPKKISREVKDAAVLFQKNLSETLRANYGRLPENPSEHP